MGQRAIAGRVAVKSERAIVPVEDILCGQIEVDTSGQLIFRFSSENRIARERLLKVGLIATKKLF